tara:strand:+ start:2345 stop:5515 length:3171 start_codon:yes stop_codon:yes gene_type:complete
MDKEILYLLLLGSLLFLKTKKFKDTMVLWAIFISSFYLLFMNKEPYVNRKTDGVVRTKLYVDGLEIRANSIGTNSIGTEGGPKLSNFSFELRVPETIAFEVLTTDECRQKCEQPSLPQWSVPGALDDINKVLKNTENKIVWDNAGTGGEYGNAGRVTMSNFLLSQDANPDGFISTLTPTVGSLGSTLSLHDTHFQASSKDPNDQTLLGCAACQYGTLEGNPAHTNNQGIAKNLGSEGCPAACIWNAWNKCGQGDNDDLRKQECSRFDTEPETGIGPDRLSNETEWLWGEEEAGGSETNRSTQFTKASPAQTPVSIRNMPNSVFKPVITSVRRINQGTDTPEPEDWSTIINSESGAEPPSYYSCINEPEGTDSGTDATPFGSCQTSQNFSWFTETPLNTDEASFTNLQRQGEYGYLSFNYSLNIGNCPPSASGEIYEITFELPKSLFCNNDETGCTANIFKVYIRCPDKDPDGDGNVPDEPVYEAEAEPENCVDFDGGIAAYCERKDKVYKGILTYQDEPESCCSEPDSCSTFSGLDGVSLKDYCKKTFNKYSIPEPEKEFVIKSEPESYPEYIKSTCCGESILTCSEPELLNRFNLDYENINSYCKDKPRYLKESTGPGLFEDEPLGPGDIINKCCGNMFCPDPDSSSDRYIEPTNVKECEPCELYTVQYRYIIFPIVIALFLCGLNIFIENKDGPTSDSLGIKLIWDELAKGKDVDVAVGRQLGALKAAAHRMRGALVRGDKHVGPKSFCLLLTVIILLLAFGLSWLLNRTILPTLLKTIQYVTHDKDHDEDKKTPSFGVLLFVFGFSLPLLTVNLGKAKSKAGLGKFFSIRTLVDFIVVILVLFFLFSFNETFIDSIYSNLDPYRASNENEEEIQKSYSSKLFNNRFSPYIPGTERTCGDKYLEWEWGGKALRDTMSEPPGPEKFKNYYVHSSEPGQGQEPGTWEYANHNDNSVYSCGKDHCGISEDTGNKNTVIYIILAGVTTYMFIRTIFGVGQTDKILKLDRLAFMPDNFLKEWGSLFPPILFIIIVIVMMCINSKDHTGELIHDWPWHFF